VKADKNFEKYYAAGLKLNGIPLLEYGNMEIVPNISSTSEGSVKVTIGNNVVLAGVKMEVGAPFEDTPDEGNLIVDANLVPLASKNFEFGPPSIDAVELARVTDRAIRESHCIETSDLLITSGEKVWTIIIDIVPLNADGDLFDISSIAAVSALLNAKFPKYEENKVQYGEFSDKKIELKNLPITTTVYKAGKYLLVAPSKYDLEFVEARLSITTIDDETIVALQKGGVGSFTKDEVKQAIEIAFSKGKEIRKILKEVFNLKK